jgi:hypothetical protein
MRQIVINSYQIHVPRYTQQFSLICRNNYWQTAINFPGSWFMKSWEKLTQKEWPTACDMHANGGFIILLATVGRYTNRSVTQRNCC